MTSTSVRPGSYNQQGRDPNTAAIMSLLLPGLGQMYNGETRKGMLFIIVAVVNLTLLLAMAFNEPILNALLSFGQQFHMKPNKMLVITLMDAHLGSPLSWILIGFFLSYVTYAVRDAYDHAALKRRRIYPDFVIELPEATSGSYIFHFSFMAALFIIAFFFIIPPQPKKQLTEIEFVDQQPKVEKRIVAKRKAQHNSENAGKHDPKKQVQAPQNAGQKQQQQQKQQQNQKQAQAQSAPKAPAPTPQPHPAPPTPKPSAQAPAPPRPSTPAPPTPAPPMPRVAPMPTPRVSAPSPSAPSPSPMRSPSPSPAMPRMAPSPMAMPNATPMPMAAAPKQFSSSIPMPSIAPASLPKAGSGAAMPTPMARPSGGGGVEGLPSITPTQIAMGSGGGSSGGSSNFAPLARSGGSQGGGSWSGPTAPGPVAASSGGGGGGKGGGGAPAPVAMSTGGGGGGGSHGGSSGAPAPVRAGRGGGGSGGSGWSSGPISIMPSVPRGGSGGEGAAGNPGPNNNPNGKPSVAAQKDVDFGPYMADLQRRIKRAWFPPRGTESRRVVVIFKVHTGGELSDLRIDKSSGIALADQAALQAVQNAAPFRQLPDGAPSVVDIQFTFDYNVFSGGGRF